MRWILGHGDRAHPEPQAGRGTIGNR